MITEQELSKYEQSARMLDKCGNHGTASVIFRLCQEMRELQKKISELEEPEEEEKHCLRCHGSGFIPNDPSDVHCGGSDICPSCGGSGQSGELR